MRTLNVSITENEVDEFGIKKNTLSFAELIALVRKELSKQALNDSIALAEKHGLSNMTMDEITAEVKAVRSHAAARR